MKNTNRMFLKFSCFLWFVLCMSACVKKKSSELSKNILNNYEHIILDIDFPDTLKYRQVAKGTVNYLNNFKDTLKVDERDYRWLRIYSYMSKVYIIDEEFPEHKSDTFVAYSKKIGERISCDFYVRKNKIKGTANLKLKILDQTFVNRYSKDSTMVRFIELPYYVDKKVFLE